MQNEEIEKKILPRLKYLGYILLVFSLIAFGYHLFSEPAEERILTEEEMVTELTEPPMINMLLVAATFGAVGATCITLAWRRSRDATTDIDR